MALFSRKNKNWHCAGCGKINIYDAQFCEFCGMGKNTSPAPAAKPVLEPGRIKCISCGAACDEGMQFCPVCGLSLTQSEGDDTPVQVQRPELAFLGVTCLHCGARNPEGSDRCSHCGRELRPEIHPSHQTMQHCCPECGTEYRHGEEFCLNCGLRHEISR